jgi:3-dehydroquinate synthase
MVTTPQGPEISTVTVPLAQRSYHIEIAGRLVDVIRSGRGELTDDLTHAFVIADEAVVDRWCAPLTESLESAGVQVDLTTVPSGETSKSMLQFERLLSWILDRGGDRRSVVFAVGGGVVGDLAGFVAASFARGIRLVQVPTTLLAMVDSSVGGKTGINLPQAKNMVGAFWQPSQVLIGTDVLSSLPDRSFLSGLAEVIKYGVIDDAQFFQWLESSAELLANRDSDALRYAITVSCQTKADVVGADERETSGRRAILNYGHTFAHAIEATAGYGKLLHGEAVAIGMQMAACLATRIGICDPQLLPRQRRLIEACRLPTRLAEADPDQMLPVMSRDKKVEHGKLRFVLPRSIGQVELVADVDPDAVRAAILENR